jgi:anti-repressor protein
VKIAVASLPVLPPGEIEAIAIFFGGEGMNELLKFDGNGNQTVSAQKLHEELEIDTPFRLWFPRMCEYGFAEGKDYTPYKFVHPQNQQEITDYSLTLSIAKEIAMLQRTERGREIRQYPIPNKLEK